MILRGAGIEDDEIHQSLHLLKNAVTDGLMVEYIRDPNGPPIERAVAI